MEDVEHGFVSCRHDPQQKPTNKLLANMSDSWCFDVLRLRFIFLFWLGELKHHNGLARLKLRKTRFDVVHQT